MLSTGIEYVFSVFITNALGATVGEIVDVLENAAQARPTDRVFFCDVRAYFANCHT